MDKPPARKHRHRGRTGAHVDQGGAEIGLVLGQHRKPRRIGTSHHRVDFDVAALDREHEVACNREIGRHQVNVGAETVPDHAARIANAAHLIERVADRQGVQDGAIRARQMLAANRQHR